MTLWGILGKRVLTPGAVSGIGKAPALEFCSEAACDQEAALRLWEESARLLDLPLNS